MNWSLAASRAGFWTVWPIFRPVTLQVDNSSNENNVVMRWHVNFLKSVALLNSWIWIALNMSAVCKQQWGINVLGNFKLTMYTPAVKILIPYYRPVCTNSDHTSYLRSSLSHDVVYTIWLADRKSARQKA